MERSRFRRTFLKSLKSQRLWCKPNHKVCTNKDLKQLYNQVIACLQAKTRQRPHLLVKAEPSGSPLVAPSSLPSGKSFTAQLQRVIMSVFVCLFVKSIYFIYRTPKNALHILGMQYKSPSSSPKDFSVNF